MTLCWLSHWPHWNHLPTLNHCVQSIAYLLLSSNIAFLGIIHCIQMLCGLSISVQPPSVLSEWGMKWPCHIPALLAGNLGHVDYFTSFGSIALDFLTFPHPAPSPQFPWCTISNYQYLNNVHQVSAESCVVGWMQKCSMTVVIQTDSHWATTASSITCMTSLT